MLGRPVPYFLGTISSYNSITGDMTVSGNATGGTGSISSTFWDVEKLTHTPGISWKINGHSTITAQVITPTVSPGTITLTTLTTPSGGLGGNISKFGRNYGIAADSRTGWIAIYDDNSIRSSLSPNATINNIGNANDSLFIIRDIDGSFWSNNTLDNSTNIKRFSIDSHGSLTVLPSVNISPGEGYSFYGFGWNMHQGPNFGPLILVATGWIIGSIG